MSINRNMTGGVVAAAVITIAAVAVFATSGVFADDNAFETVDTEVIEYPFGRGHSAALFGVAGAVGIRTRHLD